MRRAKRAYVQELDRACVRVGDVLAHLDGVEENGLPDFAGQVGRRRDLDDLLVTSLNRAVTLVPDMLLPCEVSKSGESE